MSRYLLVPNNGQYKLVPLEGFSLKDRYIILPNKLLDDTLFNRSRNTKRMIKLLVRLSKIETTRTKDGFIRIGNHILKINFYDAITRICNNTFSLQDEELYSLLRKEGLTF